MGEMPDNPYTPLQRPLHHFLFSTSLEFNCFQEDGGARLGCSSGPEKDLMQAQL